MSQPQCTCCDSAEHLLDGWGKGGLNDVCRPCFYLWYDGVAPRPGENYIRGEDIREKCLSAKASGTYPFQAGGQFA